MHEVADAIEQAIAPVPLLHIADATAAAARATGTSRPALLGTAFTMERPFLVDRLRGRHGLDVRVPVATDRDEVHRIIYEELVQGRVVARSRATCRGAIDRLVADGADGVILGCTELELLIGPDDVTVPVLATAELHARAAVAAALG